MLRFRSRLWIALVPVGLLAACSFGVDLDNLINGSGDAGIIDGAPIDSNAPTVDAGPDGSVIASVDIEQIASGANFTCVREATGTVVCWGRGTEGRLGSNDATSHSTPTVLSGLDDAIDLAVGQNHACAIRKGGAVYCWGQNDLHQLATQAEGGAPQPAVGIPKNALQLSAGFAFTCAVLEDHTVSCWGDNSQGQLGDGTTTVRTEPVAVKDLTDVKQIATTITAACALTNTGDVWCWGDNEDGQSGSGDAGGADLTVPNKVSTLSNVTALSVGSTADHICAVLATGAVQCWGYNDTGSLGTGVPGDSPIPVNVVSLNDITGIGSGTGYSCAVHKDGTVSCWGSNGNRQLAIGESGPPTADTPVSAQGLSGITQIGAGVSHVCALKGKREVVCWGSDVYGALGRNRVLQSNVPVKVATSSTFTTIANGRLHACATDMNKTATCWGDNASRQLARTDVSVTGQPGPAIPGLTDVIKVAAGEAHSCALLGTGAVRCWGAGDNGTLGYGGTSTLSTPVTFSGVQAVDVGAGNQLTCALLATGGVSCAGVSNDGRLGSPGGSAFTPRAVLAPPDGGAAVAFQGANALAVGRSHVCILHNSSNDLACWGNNDSGQLGRTTGSTSSAGDVSLAKVPVQVALGSRHTCARVAGNETRCWGRNVNGQVTGTEPSSITQRIVTFPGGHVATDLALGDDHSCAILDDKTVACWGAGSFGQLGNGAIADTNTPTLVPGIVEATAITADENHTCAITTAGTFCWGTDFNGQLGVALTMVTGFPAGVTGL